MIPIPQSLLHVPDGASFATLMSMAANHSNHVPVPAPRSVIRELDAFISRLSGFPVWKAIVDEAARFKDSLVTADDCEYQVRSRHVLLCVGVVVALVAKWLRRLSCIP